MNYESAVKKYGLPGTKTRKWYGADMVTFQHECPICGAEVERTAPDPDSINLDPVPSDIWMQHSWASTNDICNKCWTNPDHINKYDKTRRCLCRSMIRLW